MANKKVKLDLDSLTKVESITKKSRTQSYDMAFSEKTGKFRTSQTAWEKLGLFKRGFDMYLSGSKVVLALVPEDDAQMYKRRYKTDTDEPLNKGKYMTNDRMRKALNKDLGEDVNEFALVFAKEKDGVRYYVVQEWDDEEGSSLEHLGDEPEVEEEEEDIEEEESDEEEEDDIPELDEDLDFDDVEEEEEEEDPFEDL